MFTKIDERKGLVLTFWKNIRERVRKVNPQFAKIIDDINPDNKFPLYLAYYHYGAIDADTESSLFPDLNDGFYRISNPNVPRELIKHLGYSINNTPLGMVLEKEIECFIDLKNEKMVLPWLVYKPGMIFPFSRILNSKAHRIYEPNGLLSSTAGSRSAFMLPNIGSVANHTNLQRDFNVRKSTPKTLYEHWYVFKQLANSELLKSDWRCCVIYFSEAWVVRIKNDIRWSKVKQYLHEVAWNQYQYERNRIYYDITFSMIQKKRNLKPNPYLADTARHLFAIGLGAAPGYIPALNNDPLPLDVIQKAYVESYGLKKYFPTVIISSHFSFEKDNFPIYYSLRNPSTYVFSPKSREGSSTVTELRELNHIMKIFIEELSNSQGLCSDTVISEVARRVKFNFFHNKPDRHGLINDSKHIDRFDKRFSKSSHKWRVEDAKFACDAPFVRGCVSIKKNH